MNTLQARLLLILYWTFAYGLGLMHGDDLIYFGITLILFAPVADNAYGKGKFSFK